MATESPLIHDGAQTTASGDMSAKQFYAVVLTAARVVGLPTSISALMYGVLQNKPKSGQVCDVALFGITKASAGGTITAGSLVEAQSGGQLFAYTAGASAPTLGYALEAASASQIFTMFLYGPKPLTT
jgi:hypothetical protein